MAAVLDGDGIAVVDVGADVLVAGGHVRQGLEAVQLGQKPCGAADAGFPLGHEIADLVEQLVLQGAKLVLGAQDGGLHVLQLLGDVTLVVGQGLLAYVGIGDHIHEGLGDLDVVAEDLVVAHLEGLDAGAFLLLSGYPLHPALTVGHDAAEAVHLGVVALLDHAALTDGKGRLLADGAGNLVADIRKGIQLPPDAGQLLGGGVLQKPLQLGEDGGGGGHGAEVLGVGGAVDDLGDQTFEIKNMGQKLANLLPLHKAAVQLLHSPLTAQDVGGGQEGMLHPLTEHSRAGGGLGAVQHPQKGPLLLLGAHGLGQLQVAAGIDVQLQILSLAEDL